MPRTSSEMPTRRRDPEGTKREILDVATHEFAERGFSGGRVDEIAARTQTTKRMIYYYFGSKAQLYTAVLERCYGTIRLAENAVDVDALGPVAAIRRLAELTFDHHESHPDFIRLVTVENIHGAEHIAASPALKTMGNPALDVITRILRAGREQGVFTNRTADPLDVHMMISSFCVFRIANRHTFGALFGRDLTDPGLRGHYRAMVGDLVVAYLTTPGTEPGAAAD